MLECWLSQSSPAATWASLTEALRSCVIDREDIACKVEALSSGRESASSDLDQLDVNKHLTMVRKHTWDLRADWFDLGLELGVTATKLQVC